MSRDWTPREHYEVEQHFLNKKLSSQWDVMKNAQWVINGNSQRMYSDEEIALRQEYPIFGKFLENFPVLYEKLSKYENGLEFLSRKNAELSAYIETGEGDRDSYLVKWFEGKLDRNFHYRERNNQLFVESMITEVKSLVLFEDIKRQLDSIENKTSDKTQQAFCLLENGRTIEVGVLESEFFYSVCLRCNEAEFDSGEYFDTNVVTRINTVGDDINVVKELLINALECNDSNPVDEKYLPDMSEKSNLPLAEQIESAANKCTDSKSAVAIAREER